MKAVIISCSSEITVVIGLKQGSHLFLALQPEVNTNAAMPESTDLMTLIRLLISQAYEQLGGSVHSPSLPAAQIPPLEEKIQKNQIVDKQQKRCAALEQFH